MKAIAYKLVGLLLEVALILWDQIEYPLVHKQQEKLNLQCCTLQPLV